MPCLRIWKITFAAIRNFFLACTQAIIVPCSESLGYLLSNIKIQKQNLPDGPDRKEDPLLI